MSTPSEGRSRLRLVVSNSTTVELAVSVQDSPFQQVLFPANTRSLLVYIDFDRLDETEFRTLLSSLRPLSVLDLRRVPRFDLGSLNRRSVFQLFKEVALNYHDYSRPISRFLTNHHEDAFRELAAAIKQTDALAGPIFLLFESGPEMESLFFELAQRLPSPDNLGWDLYFHPTKNPNAADEDVGAHRDTLFISHANPEDNDFTLWLGAQLRRSGYRVWSDITDLKAGENFWDSIEDVIRNRAAKVIVVLSKNAENRHGLLDEVNLAVTVERTEKLRDFVIPIKLDHTAFSDVRANLARKHIITFSGGWTTGLSLLLSALRTDRVPIQDSLGPALLSDWWDSVRTPKYVVESTPERLVSNWLAIVDVPKQIHLYSQTSKSLALGGRKAFPFFQSDNLLGTFASPTLLENLGVSSEILTLRAILETDDFLQGHTVGLYKFARRDAQNHFTSLLRESWNYYAFSRGLLPYELSSGKICWYFPFGLIEGDQVRNSDANSPWRRKALYGLSKVRNVGWHFALEARFAFGPMKRLFFIEHVVFTTNGKTPLDSKEKMHRLRRSFCKNWWNDRWRDLFLASCHWLSNGQSTIRLIPGLDSLSVSSIPISLESPVSGRFWSNLDNQADMATGEDVDSLDDFDKLTDEEFVDADYDSDIDLENH